MIGIVTCESLRFIFTISYLDLCLKGDIFVIVIVFSFVTILVHKNEPFRLEVSKV